MNTQLHGIMKRTRNIYHYNIRKLKRSQDMIKKNKLLDACLNRDKDLLKEIKKIRNVKPCIANTMDGVNDDIADHFRRVYEGMYNSVDELIELCDNMNYVIIKLTNICLANCLSIHMKI